ncbi:hypothetical protein GCM10025872_23400 [Barrientosiimonas endolithica]|uniref:Uncharacterized protein n=1 Tax=Barrientosiimonas endolithica TaxID=1535208 RepID=A0ABN6YSE7_9MICO|nr:hypothetical protein GCM10025872_23400 [Barrientosiimonas endolithica]
MLNFTRSERDPLISATVSTANVSWKATKTTVGIPLAISANSPPASYITSRRPKLVNGLAKNPPTSLLPNDIE